MNARRMCTLRIGFFGSAVRLHFRVQIQLIRNVRHAFPHAVLEAPGSGRVRYTKNFRKPLSILKTMHFTIVLAEKTTYLKAIPVINQIGPLDYPGRNYYRDRTTAEVQHNETKG